MPDDHIRKFLKLFCIEESGGLIKPSWKSWLVFCLFLLVSILLAVCGVYFKGEQINLSANFCFTISAVGSGMTLVTLIAISLGYNRRRRCRQIQTISWYISNTNDGVDINDATPAMSVESICVDDKKDLLPSPQNAENNKQWTNPVYVDSDQPLYETELGDQPLYETELGDQPLYETELGDQPLYKTELEPLEYGDFEEQDSNYFGSSSETKTSKSNSSLEGDDSKETIPITSKEHAVNEVGEDYFGNNLDCGWIVEKKSSGNERVVSMEMDSYSTSSTKKLNYLIPSQESKLDPLQVYLHYKMTSCQTLERQQRHRPSSKRSNRRRNFEEKVFCRRNLSYSEIKYYGNIDSPKSFNTNSVEHNEMYPNHFESDGMALYSTGGQNANDNLALGSFKHPTDVNLKHEAHCSGEQPHVSTRLLNLPMEHQDAQLTPLEHKKDPHLTDDSMGNDYQYIAEQTNSLYSPNPYEGCQNNNNSIQLQDDESTVINTDNDAQTTKERSDGFLLPIPISSQNPNTTSMEHDKVVVDTKGSQTTVEQCKGIVIPEVSAKCRYEDEISISQGKTYSPLEVHHCEGCMSSRPMFGVLSESSIAKNFFATSSRIQPHRLSKRVLDFQDRFRSSNRKMSKIASHSQIPHHRPSRQALDIEDGFRSCNRKMSEITTHSQIPPHRSSRRQVLDFQDGFRTSNKTTSEIATHSQIPQHRPSRQSLDIEDGFQYLIRKMSEIATHRQNPRHRSSRQALDFHDGFRSSNKTTSEITTHSQIPPHRPSRKSLDIEDGFRYLIRKMSEIATHRQNPPHKSSRQALDFQDGFRSSNKPTSEIATHSQIPPHRPSRQSLDIEDGFRYLIRKMSEIVTHRQNQPHRPSRQALDIQDGFRSCNRKMSKETKPADIEQWKLPEGDEGLGVINKRLLLDMNDNPINRHAFRKTVTDLLRKGQSQFPMPQVGTCKWKTELAPE